MNFKSYRNPNEFVSSIQGLLMRRMSYKSFTFLHAKTKALQTLAKLLREEMGEKKAKCIITIATCCTPSLSFHSITRHSASLIVDFMTGLRLFDHVLLFCEEKFALLSALRITRLVELAVRYHTRKTGLRREKLAKISTKS